MYCLSSTMPMDTVMSRMLGRFLLRFRAMSGFTPFSGLPPSPIDRTFFIQTVLGVAEYQGWLPNDTQPTQEFVDVCLYPVALTGLSILGTVFVRSLALSLERLEVSRRDYREIFDAVDDGIIVHDLEGKVVDANQATLKMTGYAADEVASVRLEDVSGAQSEYGQERAP